VPPCCDDGHSLIARAAPDPVSPDAAAQKEEAVPLPLGAAGATGGEPAAAVEEPASTAEAIVSAPSVSERYAPEPEAALKAGDGDTVAPLSVAPTKAAAASVEPRAAATTTAPAEASATASAAAVPAGSDAAPVRGEAAHKDDLE